VQDLLAPAGWLPGFDQRLTVTLLLGSVGAEGKIVSTIRTVQLRIGR
jgi:hypothetical protein